MLGEAPEHEFQPNYKLSAFEIGHLFSRNINYSINLLLRLCLGTRIIYIQKFNSVAILGSSINYD